MPIQVFSPDCTPAPRDYCAAMTALRIDIWSDIACPWCYVGKRRLEAALQGLPGSVEIVWRSFELDPSAPRERDRSTSYAARLAAKYGKSVGDAEAMIERMTETAAKDGLDFRFDKVRSGNTFDAHRVLHMAGERGVQNAMKERLLRAYMTEGEPIGDRDALARLAADAGLDRDEVRAMLDTDQYASDVREDEQEARELGIHGVPFFVLGGRYAVSGAQPADVLRGAVERARRELELESAAAGAACGPDGCAV